jgi:hypothetical protein
MDVVETNLLRNVLAGGRSCPAGGKLVAGAAVCRL